MPPDAGEGGRAGGAASTPLPVRRLTLYKHGVSFVERAGAVSGESVRLDFPARDVNDALKSLFVFDRHGGSVLGIQYETQPDQDARVAESPLILSDDHALLDLLRALRGCDVRLTLGTGTERQETEGRVVGVERRDDAPARLALVSLWREADHAVAVYRLGDVRQVAPRDERAERDLRHFLDVSRRDESRRTITVRLSPGEHDLTASYLQASPTWRVSYRLVAERASPAVAAAPSGTLLLQGWGLFDNHLEEDLAGVQVALVAGQPISFIYDLATSRVPARRVVQDQARVAPGPVELERPVQRRRAAPAEAPSAEARYLMERSEAHRTGSAAASMLQRLSFDAAAQQEVVAAGSEMGELFSYQVTAPVSVGRGESALVPILSAQLPYERELVFNPHKLPDHPVAALRFTNGTGLVLERGPVTVVEDGEYRGEALVPFTARDSEVYLAFAVELGVTVKRTEHTRSEVAGLRIERALLWTKQAVTIETTYELTNDLVTGELVTIEHPIRPGAALVDTRPPDSSTPEWYRWRVPCPPKETVSFAVSERWETWQQQTLLDLSYDALRQYLDRRWLDDATIQRVRALLQERAQIAKNDEELRELSVEREDLYRREEELRKNLAALGTTGQEAALRQRVFDQLHGAEDRLTAIDARMTTLRAHNKQRQAALETSLANLSTE